jgi:cold-inducible RNA-binding protein
MGKKLRVGNLGYAINSDRLKEIFAPAGTVKKANIVEDQYSGKSRGFGFVEMSSEKEAAAGLELFNGKEHDGRVLAVSEAPPEARSRTSRAKKT